MLVVLEPLLMECLVTVQTLDHLHGEVMVGQPCLILNLEKNRQDDCSVEHSQ